MFGMSWIIACLLTLLQGNWLAGAQAPTITLQPENTYVVKSGVAELNCEASGKTPLTYEWYQNDQRIQSTDRRKIHANGHLFIMRVIHKRKKSISDTGRYYCTVSNKDGVTKSKVVNVTMGNIRKQFREHPLSQSISRGRELTLKCIPPRGKPRPKVAWLKDGRDFAADGIRILLEERSQKLVIKAFKKEDEGKYKCEATNVAGRRLSDEAVITSTVPPKIILKPKDKTVDISIQSQTTLSCKADGVPPPAILWKKEGNNTILPSTDGKLTLTNLKPRDIGKYSCIAYNTEGNVSSSALLTLHYVPEFAIVSDNVNQMEGSTVKLKCLANSLPYPTIYWRKTTSRKNYAINDRIGHIRTERDDRTIYLIFQPLKLSDAGNYTCEASNKIGSRRRNVNIAVYGKAEFAPAIESTQVAISADINSKVTIICDVKGNPKPTVTWSKSGENGSLGDGVILTDELITGTKYRYFLVISKVQENNGGTFQCTASNKIQTVAKDFTLQVSKKLHLSKPIKAGVPSAPKNVRIAEYNDHSARIEWVHNDDPVVVYAVGYINVDERSNEQYASYNVNPTLDEYVVKGLKQSTRYMFFVRGINKIGQGVPSLLTDVIRTRPAVPTSPASTPPTKFEPTKLQVSLTEAGAGELDVSWNEVDQRAIDGYYIYWKVKGSKTKFQKETLQNNQARRYRISDLQNSTKYSVQVQVFKGARTGPKSKPAHHKTSKKPVSLIMTSVEKNDSESVSVSWKRLWKKNSGEDTFKLYIIHLRRANNKRRRKRDDKGDFLKTVELIASYEHYIIGGLTPGASYTVWMTVTTSLGRQYKSQEKTVELPALFAAAQKSKWNETKDFILQPWFLGVMGGVLLILVLGILLCCFCRRSSPKKDVDNLSIQLQERNPPEAVRKPSEGPSTETDALSPASRTRESSEYAESYDERSSSVYRISGSPRTPAPSDLDFPNIQITPNKYERMYRSLDAKGNDSVNYGRAARKYSENDFDSPTRYNPRQRNPYSPAPRPSCLSIDQRSDYDNAKPKCESTPEPAARSPTRRPYPGEAPPDYETAIAENTKHEDDECEKKPQRNKESRQMDDMPHRQDRFGILSSRQSSCSPASECSNPGSSLAGRRKGLKPPPRLTIASVNWADMLPPPPSHPPPSSVATRSPPPSPTGTSMCSETTYGRSHASSFLPRRSGSVVSADMQSDFEKEAADSVRSGKSGKSKGKSENKLPFDLAGITSDIIMQWADSVTNTSGSEDDSSPSSPDRRSGISSDGSFLTDTDFANAVKAAAECGGFNIDIDLNMYKAMDPISFQPFAGSLSTYNPETSSSIKPPVKKAASVSKDGDGLRDSSRGRRARSENSHDLLGNLSLVKENPMYASPNASEAKNIRRPRNVNNTTNNGSQGYVPALTRTSALGKLEPVNRGQVKKKYAVVKTLPQCEDTPDYTPNYPSHSLSSSTSNASTIRSSSCPPETLTDEDTEDDVI